MHEIGVIEIDDPIVCASVSHSVCHVGECSYSFARWHHFDAAITALLFSLV